MKKLSFWVAIGVAALASVSAQAAPVFWQSPIRPPALKINAYVLTQSVAESITVPSFSSDGIEANREVVVVFSPSTNCTWYYRSGATATVPSADTTDGTASARNPAALRMRQSASISAISPDTDCKITVEFYPVPR